jgi:hypothetical protein
VDEITPATIPPTVPLFEVRRYCWGMGSDNLTDRFVVTGEELLTITGWSVRLGQLGDAKSLRGDAVKMAAHWGGEI